MKNMLVVIKTSKFYSYSKYFQTISNMLDLLGKKFSKILELKKKIFVLPFEYLLNFMIF